jgi:hypothetical protein
VLSQIKSKEKTAMNVPIPKLSEAMAMGDSLRDRNPGLWLEYQPTGRYCGCAIGGAILASGRTGRLEHHTLWPWLYNINEEDVELQLGGAPIGKYAGMYHVAIISRMFDMVCRGTKTFDEIVAYTRSVEPQCDCHRFNCSCVKEAAPVAVEREEVCV